MDPCKEAEPRVINNELLERCVEEQGPKGEAGRLAKEEGIPLDEVEQIRLEFLKILRIDHLWVLESITKLSLSNNFIETIENLDSLIHLTDLDLSFNKLSKIQNLEKLTKLKFLSFFENRITTIENMDAQKKLTIFSIGKNFIEDRSNVIYLRRFYKLNSLNMVGNPCAEDEDFRLYVAAILPQIVYYEYKLLYDMEKELGLETYRVLLRQIENDEFEEVELRERIEAELAEAELHSESFVEFLGGRHLFDSMFETDDDGKLLLEMGDDVKEYYTEYEEQFLVLTLQIFQMGQEQYLIRKAEVEHFLHSVDGAKLKSQEESIQHMEIFLEGKAEIFYQVKRLQDDLDNEEISVDHYNEHIQEYADEFNDLIHKTWKVLMKLELTLFEQMEEVNQTFEHALTEMVNTFIEAAQGFFAQIRALEVTYAENIGEHAGHFLTTAALTEDFQMPEILAGIMADREILNNALGGSHDMHMLMIDNREDRLVSRAHTWLNNLVDNLQKNEIERDRSNVLEINHFMDIQREEFEDLHGGMLGPVMDPDVSAALT